MSGLKSESAALTLAFTRELIEREMFKNGLPVVSMTMPSGLCGGRNNFEILTRENKILSKAQES